jgi:hypothetical protein
MIMNLLDIVLDTPPRMVYQSLLKRLLAKKSLTEFNSKHPCVFVLSTGRVGSMTLASLLNYSDNLIALHEPKPVLYSISKAAYQSQTSCDENIWNKVFMCLRDEQIDNSLRLGKGYVETSPQATFLAPIIAKAIQNVKFIHLIRNPADVIRSGLRRDWYSGHPADENRITPRADSKFHNQWHEMTLFQKNSWLWSETNRWILEFIMTLPPNRVHTLHSEDLYLGKLTTLEPLFDFCGSEIPTPRQIDKVLSRKLNIQNTGYYPLLKDWSSEDIKMLNDLTGDIAKKMGCRLD